MIAIIGGGPAGIALACALDSAGMDYQLFESRALGATWRSVPSDLRVLSPWWTDVLRTKDIFRANPLSKPNASQYLEHLHQIAEELRGEVLENHEILALLIENKNRFFLKSNQDLHGPYSHVCIATGYYFFPREFTPAGGNDGSVPLIHAGKLKDYDQLNALEVRNQPFIVVGGRVTAGQLLTEMYQRGLTCEISIRSPLEFRREGLIASVRENLYFIWEQMQIRFHPDTKRESFPVMDGGEPRFLISSGVVRTRPVIERIRYGEVEFSDGQATRASAIILATGYQPTFDFLPSALDKNEYSLPTTANFELTNVPGVYLLGFDNLRNHRSRYLRGIRSDAKELAGILTRSYSKLSVPDKRVL